MDVTSVNRVPVELVLHSSDPRVIVSKNVSVAVAGKISVDVDASGLVIGDEIRGRIDVIYNGGETSIPYRFRVGVSSGSAASRFETLKAFADFAKDHEEEAANLFTWKEFLMMPFMRDLVLKGLYRAFESSLHPVEGMKEFLKAAGETLPEVNREERPLPLPKPRPVLSTGDIEKRLKYRLIGLYLKVRSTAFKKADFTPVLEELYALSISRKDHPDVRILYAYALILAGDPDDAKEELLSVQDLVQRERQSNKERYAMFLYVAGLASDDEKRIAKTAAIVHKYWQEGVNSGFMAVLEYTLNQEINSDPEKQKDFLLKCDVRGLNDPVVVFENALLYASEDLSNDSLDAFELKTVLSALKYGLFSEQKLFAAFSIPLKDPALLNLYIRALKAGYMKFGNPEFLQAVVNVYLQKKWSGERYFAWYARAVEEKMTIRGLYEYYLASLPERFEEPLPYHLVRYFGLQKDGPYLKADRLYLNVIRHYAENDEIMELFRKKIDRYAMRAAEEERYEPGFKPLFRRILSKDYISETTAGPLLKLFYLNEISTSLSGVRRIVLYYPELDREDSYPADQEGKTHLAPIFSEMAVLSFETSDGVIRYDANARVRKVFDDPDMKKQCALYAGESLLFKLSSIDEVVKTGTIRENDLFNITALLKDKRISDLYRTRLYEALIDLVSLPSMQHLDASDYLSEAPYDALQKSYRRKILSIFIDRGKEALALERVLKYGSAGLDDERLLKLMEFAVSHEVTEGNEAVLSYAYRLFSHDSASPVIFESLSKFYNGSSEDMVALVKAIRKKKLPLFDLVERTLTLLLFTGNTKDLDPLFDAYAGELNRNETLIRAVLVLKSHEYYTEKKRLSETEVFELRKQVKTLPRIGYLALMEYYADHPNEVTEKDLPFLAEMIRIGVNENVIPSSISRMKNVVNLPFELENRVFLTFRDSNAEEVTVTGQLFPGNRMFHKKMIPLYPGVFEQSFFLYPGEWIQYEILSTGPDGAKKEEKAGVISRTETVDQPGGRLKELQILSKKAKEMEIKDTAEYLKSMLIKEALVNDIFTSEG